MLKLKHKGKQVLQVQDVTAELKVCQGTVDLHKEKKKEKNRLIPWLDIGTFGIMSI